jgi:hypothetical protein
MQASENRAEDQFASVAGADDFPAGGSIESLRSGAGIGREHGGAMSGAAQRLAGGLKKSAADAATLAGRIERGECARTCGEPIAGTCRGIV